MRLFSVLLCLFVAGSAVAQPPADCPSKDELYELIDDAGRSYVMRRFTAVQERLSPVLVVGEGCVIEPEAQIEVRLLMGMSAFELGEQDVAELHFLTLLRLEPDYTVDPSIATLTIEQFFEGVRSAHKDELDEIRALRGRDLDNVEVQNVWVVAEDSLNHYWLNFLPFGAGSFQNGDTGWGIFFAVMQGLTLGMNITGAAMVEVVRGDSHTFTAAEAELARSWQYVQFVGLGLFGVFYIWGVVDGAINFVERERVYLPPSFDPPPELEAEGDTLIWYIAPYGAPDGGGVTAGVAF